MRVLKISIQFAAFVMLFLFIACASTKFSAIWKDETYQGHPKKILVINALQNPVNRRLFEDELVKTLKDRGIDAVVSYTVMPNAVLSNKNAIAAQAKEAGADTVLINKPISTRTDESLGAGPVYYDNLYIKMQTDVYDMKSKRVVLSATAETWIRQDASAATNIHSYVKELVNKLSQQGIF